MGYEHLAISLHSRSGAQHWQRAALVIALFGGFLSGIVLYVAVFNRLSVPVSDNTDVLGVALHKKDAHSYIGQELTGYIQSKDHLIFRPESGNTKLLVDSRSGTIVESSKKLSTKTIISLWPTSYISYNQIILPLRTKAYGANILIHRLKKQKLSPIADQMSFLQIKDSPLVGLFSDLSVSRIEFNKDNQTIASGTGDEAPFISLLSSLDRPILTKATTLEDGTAVTELRATPHDPTIETTGGISSYSSNQPFFLATHNKDSKFWALRNVPTKPSSSNTPTLQPSTCPAGSIGSIDTDNTMFFNKYKFVINILDKITLTKSGVHLCLSVDKM